MLDLHNSDLTTIYAVERARREEIAHNFRQEHILRETEPRKASLLDRILVKIGTVMVSTGRKLQERSVLVLSHSSGTNQIDC
jgi:hypothetical protein